MAEEMNWQERMERENAEIDRLLDGGAAEGEKPEEAAPGEGVSGKPDEAGEIGLLSVLENAANDTSPGDDGAQAEPTPTGGDEALRARVAELEAQLQRERSENGRARVLADKVRTLEAERDELKERMAALEGRPRPFEGPLGEFSEEESEMMSPELRQSLSARFAALDAGQKALNKKMAEADAMVATSKRAAMQQAIGVRFPGLDRYLTGDAWKRYCTEFDPVSRKTNGQLFVEATSRFDTEATVAIIDRFVRATGIGDAMSSAGSMRPGEISGYPQAVSGGGGKGKVYKYDEVNAFLNAVYSGRLPLSDPENKRRYDELSAAMDEGRVEM